MSQPPDPPETGGLTPEQLAALEAQVASDQQANDAAKRLSWDAFLAWLTTQQTFLKANPGLLESIIQVGPALLAQLARIVT